MPGNYDQCGDAPASPAGGRAPRLSIMAAMAQNRVIGRDGQLPWRLPADLRRFKQITLGHPLIMGRKTFESIGRVLPGRTSIVLTRQLGFQYPGIVTAASLDEAIHLSGNTEEIFVIGGGQVYSLAFPRCGRLYLTIVQTESAGDTTFPEWDPQAWQLVEQSSCPADDQNLFPLLFQVLDRVTSPSPPK